MQRDSSCLPSGLQSTRAIPAFLPIIFVSSLLSPVNPTTTGGVIRFPSNICNTRCVVSYPFIPGMFISRNTIP